MKGFSRKNYDVVTGMLDFRTPLAGPVELLHRPRHNQRQVVLKRMVQLPTGVRTKTTNRPTNGEEGSGI